jgi:hypothetical protein
MSEDKDAPLTTTMLEDILNTDKEEAVPLPAEVSLPANHTPPPGSGFLNLAHLNSNDFSVIIAALMNRLGVTEIVITDADLRALDATPAHCTVMAAYFNESTQNVTLRLLTGPQSEFRP